MWSDPDKTLGPDHAAIHREWVRAIFSAEHRKSKNYERQETPSERPNPVEDTHYIR
jgi:hypothetical protein